MPHRLACVAVFTLVYGVSASAWGQQQSRGVIYDFTATWCGPCQQMAPIVENLQRQGLPIRKVDIDQQKEFANRFQIESIPTFVLVIDGKEADRRTGAITDADLRQMAARIPASAGPAAPNGAVETGGPMAIPVALGEPAAWLKQSTQSGEPKQVAQAEATPATEPPSSPGRGIWPFRKKAESGPSVIRATDAELSPPESSPSLPEETPSANGGIDPMLSSVRIRVIINGGINLGSGTVIHCDRESALVLTCGHIFRGFNDDAKIEVDVFDDGRPRLAIARLVKFNEEADLGLITVPVSSETPCIRVAGVGGVPQVGEPVASIGCNGGEDPTRQQLRVTAIDKYNGPSNIECTGIPVQGRSGGGLFNRHAEIIGVCVAADKMGQRGLYAGLNAIHQLLDECSLTSLYRQPDVAVATTAAPASVEDFTANPRTLPTAAASEQPANPAAPPLDVQAGSAEVIVIVRDNASGAQQRVVILHQASPKFMSYLNGELNGQTRQTAELSRTPVQSMPEVGRELRTASADERSTVPFVQQAELAPTTYAQPVIPRRFSRSRPEPSQAK